MNINLRNILLLLPILFISFVQFGFAQKRVKRVQNNVVIDWTWKYSSQNEIDNFEIIGDNVLLTTASAEKDKKTLSVVDTKTGKLKWKMSKTDFFYDEANIILASDNKSLEGIDFSTGKIKWKVSDLDLTESRSLRVFGNNIYLAVNEEGVVALDLATGQRKWSYRPCFDLDYEIQITEKYLVVPCQTNKMYVADAQTGQQLWKKDYFENEVKKIFIKDDSVITAVEFYEGNGGIAESYNLNTGTFNWAIPLTGGNSLEDAKLHNNKLYVTFLHGSFWIIDAKTGEITKSYKRDIEGFIEKTVKGQDYGVTTAIDKISIANSTVLGTTEDGFIYAFDSDSGEQKWVTELSIYPRIQSANDEFSIIYENDVMKVFSTDTGKQIGKINGIIDQVETDQTGNIYALVGKKDVCQLTKENILLAVKSRRNVLLPKSLAKSYPISRRDSATTIGVDSRIFMEAFSSVTYTNSTLYLTHASFQSGKLLAINAKNGVKEVVYSLEGKTPISQPSILKGTAYFTTQTNLYSIDVKNKKLNWKIPIRLAEKSAALFIQGEFLFYTDKGKIYAHSQKDGELLWTADSPIGTSFSFGKDCVFVFDNYRHIIGLNLADGSIKYKLETGKVASFEVVKDRLITFDFERNLSGFEIETGKQIWTYVFGRTPKKFYKDDNENLFISTTQDNLFVIDTKNGNIKWERKFYFNSPLFSHDFVLSKSYQPSLYLYNPESGIIKYKNTDSSLSDFDPTANDENGVVFMQKTEIDAMIAFDTRSNKKLWTIKLK
jgi:outer membrane protein assembly factor BamB